MRIGIDASRANKKIKTGVEWYSYHLIQEFKKIDIENQYFLYTNTSLFGSLANCPPNFKEKKLSWPIPRSWTLARLSYEMKWGKNIPDVLFVPAHTIPLLNPKRSIVTIHDLGFEHYPHIYRFADKFYHKFIIRFIKRFATQIIAVSNFTKKDLMDKYGIAEARIAVVHNGYDNEKYRPSEKHREKAPDFKYILFVGRLEEKKNVKRLIEAFAIYKAKHLSDKHKLVLIGKPGFGFDKIMEVAGKEGLKDDIVMTGWLGDDELPSWMANADLFVFPSLFEGFGIPVLEAMGSGTPVICSNTTSLPEIAGDAALMFDPERTEEIAARMEQVLLNPEVAESLVEKGFRRASMFSWRKCAEETLSIIKG
jgi:glycosyltransferase involved in cell wall biosynthesis